MPIPTPRSDESQAAFVSRAHEELAGEFPDTDQRNAVIFRQWREHRGGSDSVERKAREKFNSKRFVKIPDVCVFTEHTTKDREGNTVVYDKAALEKIAARCNERILDTGNFAPITLGHTPTEEELAAGAQMPDIAGFAGNFRLGLKGNKNPRWAIFQDEYHFAEDAQKLEKRPRRSVELWTEERMEDRFFDPIAALGAETPRLDTGHAYSRRPGPSGKCVAKYARTLSKKYAAVPVAPGAAAVHPKDDHCMERHAAPTEGAPPETAPGATGMALTPEDAKMIVSAIEELDWVQWVKKKMGEESGAHEGEPPGSSGSPSGSISGGSSGSPSGHEHGSSGTPSGSIPSGSPSGTPSGSIPSGSPSGTPSHYAADGSPSGSPSESPEVVPNKKYGAGSVEGSLETTTGQTAEGKIVNTGTGTVAAPDLMKLARKSDKKSRYRRLEKRLEALEQENAGLRKRERDAIRYSRLADLAARGWVFEIAEELEDTADLDDKQFDRHIERMQTRYSRAPVGEPPFYVPQHIEGDNKKPDDKQKQIGERVKQKAEMYAKREAEALHRGERVPHKTYQEIYDEVSHELNGQATTKTA